MKIRFYLITIIICLLVTSVQAQDNNARQIYNQAENEYAIGRIEQATTLLQDNMDNFHGNLRQSAFRLLALCHLGLDDIEKAEEDTRRLLNEDPYYTASPQDPLRFIDMVENLRSGLTATITTASSQAENLNEVPVPTTLITEEMIRNSGARNLQEVLSIYVPSMNIIDCNDDVNISMRGIYSNGQEKILIMLNGHRLNSYSTNIAAPDFSMSLDKLKQIEVLRGPASSLYGGVSLTAVVNLITKQGADIDGIKLKAGIGNHGQYRGDALFGKRYFDLDMLVWGSFFLAKGEKRYITKEQTALPDSYGHAGDITIGGIGNKPSYDYGISLKYKNLRFLYNTQFSQIQSPMTMTYLFAPYDIEKYKTYNGIRPSFTTTSHHADLSYGQQFHNFYLKGTFAYDNSDMAHYQVISDTQIPGFVD
ncbi:MAG: TonB-dependent receptor plug domain-containing protein, partial [Prevotella sp.]|nr:TonB-dependent receptor plug domain-containing protein [Prevotella sp.]